MCLYAIAHTHWVGEDGKGMGLLLRAGRGVVCFVSKTSICLCEVIPYDLPKYTGPGCPSVGT